MNNWMNDWKTIDNDDEICLSLKLLFYLLEFLVSLTSKLIVLT